MSFSVRCPFCKAEMECPDDMLGQVGQCISCGKEIDLDDDRPAAPSDTAAAQAMRTIRAASIAATMPRITWSWAFDAVLKITVAVILVDGAVALAVWIIRSLFGGR